MMWIGVNLEGYFTIRAPSHRALHIPVHVFIQRQNLPGGRNKLDILYSISTRHKNVSLPALIYVLTYPHK